MLKHSFVVHSGDSMNGDVFFMEVSARYDSFSSRGKSQENFIYSTAQIRADL